MLDGKVFLQTLHLWGGGHGPAGHSTTAALRPPARAEAPFAGGGRGAPWKAATEAPAGRPGNK